MVPTLAPDSARTQRVCGTELLLVAALGSRVPADRFARARLLEDFFKRAGGLAEDLFFIYLLSTRDQSAGE